MSAPHSEYERERMAENARNERRGPATGAIIAVGVLVLLAIIWMFASGGEAPVNPDGAPVQMEGAEPGAMPGAVDETIPAPTETIPAPAE